MEISTRKEIGNYSWVWTLIGDFRLRVTLVIVRFHFPTVDFAVAIFEWSDFFFQWWCGGSVSRSAAPRHSSAGAVLRWWTCCVNITEWTFGAEFLPYSVGLCFGQGQISLVLQQASAAWLWLMMFSWYAITVNYGVHNWLRDDGKTAIHFHGWKVNLNLCCLMRTQQAKVSSILWWGYSVEGIRFWSKVKFIW